MRIAVGVDHAGFPLKDLVIEELRRCGHEPLDLGTDSTDPVDYPDYALAVAEAVTHGEAVLGVLLCGSGVGASIAANKVRGIRAALCHDTYSAHQSREHDNANVLVIGPRVVGAELARDILHARFWPHGLRARSDTADGSPKSLLSKRDTQSRMRAAFASSVVHSIDVMRITGADAVAEKEGAELMSRTDLAPGTRTTAAMTTEMN